MRYYFIKFNLLLLITLLLNACGGETTSATSSGGELLIETKRTLIGSNQKEFFIEFAIENHYIDDIEVELSDISVEIESCNTKKSFPDTPKLEQSYLLSSMINFATACTPTGYKVKATQKLTYEGKSNHLPYESELIEITPDDNITFEDKNTVFDYDIELRAINGSSKIELNTTKRYKLSLNNQDTNSSVFNTNSDFQEENVDLIIIESTDASKIQLIEPSNYLTNNEEATTQLTFENISDVDLYIRTYDTSGVVNLNVVIEYTNNRGEKHKIETTTSLTILSGEPTAFSINSAGTIYNPKTKWFEQKFLISASDKYNNTLNIKSKINISAMADFTRDINGNRLIHGKYNNLTQDIKGELIADKETNSAIFRANIKYFTDNIIDNDRDFLLLFGDVNASEALGKWDIDAYHTDTTLNLRDSYQGNSHNNLGFAIGHNYLNEICSSESKEWELKIDSTDGTYQLDNEGKTYVTLKFPVYMIGKKIALSVNFSGKDLRSGEVHFETLHSFEGVKVPETINIDANTTTSTIESFSFEVDTGTEDRYFVKNAEVYCKIVAKNVEYKWLSKNREIKTLSDCMANEDGEIAYGIIRVDLIDLEKSGTLTFERCQVDDFIDAF